MARTPRKVCVRSSRSVPPSGKELEVVELRSLFYPRSIALVGASERSPWSHMLHDNLARLGYEGKVYAVNKTGSNAHGYRGYTSCVAIGEPVDAAYLFVPIEATLEAFADILQAGIKSI